MQNTIKMAGMQACTFTADKGFFSEANVSDLEKLEMKFIIPLRRDNKQINYKVLDDRTEIILSIMLDLFFMLKR